jgi:hypothetical protein
LERTTRADAPWVNPDQEEKLTHFWADGTPFSFDLGGLLRGGKFDGQEFVAEIKNYTTAGDQGTSYPEYLAKCYRAFTSAPSRLDHFMWLTWHPFSLGAWASLCESQTVQGAVVRHRVKCLGEHDETRANRLLDVDICQSVADRLWLIVLSAKQEELVIEDEDLDFVYVQQRKRQRLM